MNVEETHADYTLSYGKAKTPAPSVGQPLQQALNLYPDYCFICDILVRIEARGAR